MTPLSLASREGHLPVCQFLVGSGAKVGDALSHATAAEILRFLETAPELNQQLRDAAKEGDLVAVTCLVRIEGAQVDGADEVIECP